MAHSLTPAWLQDSFTATKKRYASQPFADVQERKRRLLTLKQLLVTHQDEICQAIDADFNGRAVIETQTIEWLPSMMGINHTLRHLNQWMKPRRKLIPLLFQPASAKLVAQPLGVVGVIVPWNYPLFLAVGPLTAALAAGNHVMIKMSEFTPQFGELFARLIAEYFDPDCVSVVNGGLDVAEAFAALPFDHLLFTGSTPVGKHIMRAASDNLTPVTLELGGKSPAVIDRSIPVRQAAERLVYPKCLNAGQTCVAPDYVLCPQEQVDAFVQHFLSEAKQQFGDVRSNPDYSAIINLKQRERLIALLADAEAKGAQLYVAGDSDDLSDYDNKLPPIVVTGVHDDMTLMQEEIFGPILPVVAYQHRQETLNYINQRPHPLALYVFGYDKALKPLFSQQTHSGALMFNEAVIHVGIDNLPFGGVGASGMGQYHGVYGFENFSKLKPVVSKGRLNSMALVYPPYKGWLMKWILRVFGR